MTPRERLVAAFELRQPDDIVPTFELQFQLAGELLGRTHLTQDELEQASGKERERLIRENAELYVLEAETLDYSLVALSLGPWSLEDQIATVRAVREMVGNTRMVAAMADGTMSIPDGKNMMDVVIRLSEQADEVKTQHEANASGTIEFAKRMVDAGVDAFLMCADYCFNDGPFLSPNMFRQFVTPYLARVIEAMREAGAYAIKHTDGDIMPILDQLVECRPHALHSLDPMAGVSMAKVKEMVGDRVALCGNVNCAILQTGTVEDVIADSERSLREGMPGGGYVYCTSNTPFIGMPLQNYLAMLEVRRRSGGYA